MEKQPFEQQPHGQPEQTTGHRVEQPIALAEPDVTALAEWLDVELEKLVARWVHLAAPRAGRASFGRRSCP
jgi:hypothetical protein